MVPDNVLFESGPGETVRRNLPPSTRRWSGDQPVVEQVSIDRSGVEEMSEAPLGSLGHAGLLLRWLRWPHRRPHSIYFPDTSKRHRERRDPSSLIPR